MTDLFFEAAAAVLPLDAASAMALANGWLLGNGACGGDPQKMDASRMGDFLYDSNSVVALQKPHELYIDVVSKTL